MTQIVSIENAVSPEHRSSYIIDWMMTFLCNLDCSYCTSHDNTTKHPSKDKCKESIDFALQYADIMLDKKKKFERAVTVNILGGEPLMHPDFPEILEYLHNVHKQRYQDKWPLTVCLMTNGTAGKNTLLKCLPYIGYITVSYHTESNEKQKQLCVESIYAIKEAGRDVNIRLMAHSDPDKFEECKKLAEQFDRDGIAYSYKPIGVSIGLQNEWTVQDPERHSYNREQAVHIVKFWNSRNKNLTSVDELAKIDDRYIVASKGYPCCAEKPLCINQDRKNPVNRIPQTNFKDWYCSVNWQFLHIDQLTGNVYHNTSCHVNYDNQVGPIGNLANANDMINKLTTMLDTNTMNIIKCPKAICGCGMCAPKAATKEDFLKIMSVRIDTSVLTT